MHPAHRRTRKTDDRMNLRYECTDREARGKLSYPNVNTTLICRENSAANYLRRGDHGQESTLNWVNEKKRHR